MTEEFQLTHIVQVTVVTEDNKENYGARTAASASEPRPRRRGAPAGRKLFRDITKEIPRKDVLDTVSVLTADG